MYNSLGVDVIQSSAELPGLWRGLPQLVDFWRAQYETTLLDLGHGQTAACHFTDKINPEGVLSAAKEQPRVAAADAAPE